MLAAWLPMSSETSGSRSVRATLVPSAFITYTPYLPLTIARNAISCPFGGRNAIGILHVHVGRQLTRRLAALGVEEVELAARVLGVALDDRQVPAVRRPVRPRRASSRAGADVDRAQVRSIRLDDKMSTVCRTTAGIPEERDPGAVRRVAGRAVDLGAADEQPARAGFGIADVQVAGGVVHDLAVAGRSERAARPCAASRRQRVPRGQARSTRGRPRSAATEARARTPACERCQPLGATFRGTSSRAAAACGRSVQRRHRDSQGRVPPTGRRGCPAGCARGASRWSCHLPSRDRRRRRGFGLDRDPHLAAGRDAAAT